jgi:hypothetical protein
MIKRTKSDLLVVGVCMNNLELRVYVTDHQSLWQVYKIFIGSDGSFYRVVTIKDLPEHDKYSYHTDGTIHSKTKLGKKVTQTFNWPNFKELTTAIIDSYGFDGRDFKQNDPVYEKMKVTRIKPPGIVFDISQNIDAFVIRIWFGKTENIMDFQTIIDRLVEVPSDIFVAAQFYSFGRVSTKLGDFDLSCVVALIPLEEL